MTKEKNNENKNIVYFPFLKDRLLEKGIAALEQKQYDEASRLLRQAYEIDPTNPDISSALVLSLYENKQYKEAKTVCKELLLEGVGEYFEIVELYLMILIQLSEHKEVIDTIHALFEEKEIPFEKEDHFKKLLSFSEKILKGGRVKELDQDQDIDVSTENPPLVLTGKGLEEQTLFLAQLVNRNIQPFKKEFYDILQKNESHPFLQTMILNVLIEHGINEKVEMNKFGFTGEINPSELAGVFDTAYFLRISSYLEDHVLHKNPTLYQQIMESFKQHCFVMYPFELEGETEQIGKAYELFGHTLYGIYSIDHGEKESLEKNENVQELLEKIVRLEEISSPTI